MVYFYPHLGIHSLQGCKLEMVDFNQWIINGLILGGW
jgi:hypothetical protein